MKVKGRKRYVKRAVFAARLLGIEDFELNILEVCKDTYSYAVKEGPKKYLICIREDLPKSMIMDFLGHEMVHIAQYVRGDMEDHPCGTLWKGELFDDGEHLSDLYFMSPWEMEARALEGWINYRWETRNELH